ncbi:MAG: hypothetical protein FWE88_05735 [Phycisphaerae bacterium]|nr:hypothetical protein [Phycisphaerae bacterium]
MADKDIMEGHRRLCELHERMVMGLELTEPQRREAVAFFLRQVETDAPGFQARRAYKSAGGTYAPLFYAPPWHDGKRACLVTGHLPKTGILHANHYELEILRLLLLLDRDHAAVRDMAAKTVARLNQTCFAQFCPQGECTSAGICALRFFHVFNPRDHVRRNKLLEPLGRRFLLATASRAEWQNHIPISYFLLTLAELNNHVTHALIRARQDWLGSIAWGKHADDIGAAPADEGHGASWLARSARLALATLPEWKENENRSKHRDMAGVGMYA